MDSKDFQTKTLFFNKKSPTLDGFHPIALDIGYSAVKGFSPSKIFCFPSFAKRKVNAIIGTPDDAQILYKDGITGEEWVVGQMAYEMMSSDDSNESVSSLYGRNRYYSPMFTVIARTGLGLGLLNNQNVVNDNILLQTGLPPKFIKEDSPKLKECLEGEHIFDLKIGNNPWKHFSFKIDRKNISIMPQPMGTLYSTVMDNEAHQTDYASKMFRSNVIIFDAGFGTLDIFDIRNGSLNYYETFGELGMKRVLTETCNEIYAQYLTDIPVYSMQTILKTGYFKYYDRRSNTSKKVEIDKMLEEANREVCYEALNKVQDACNNLIDHDYFVITGGTGAAWENYIKEYFSGMETLTVMSGNVNDSLPCIFANVRGYYMFLISSHTCIR